MPATQDASRGTASALPQRRASTFDAGTRRGGRSPRPSGGYAPAREMLDREDRPTALFCYNDRMAMGAYRAAAELGLRIPEDLSVVGFDNQELIAEGCTPG